MNIKTKKFFELFFFQSEPYCSSREIIFGEKNQVQGTESFYWKEKKEGEREKEMPALERHVGITSEIPNLKALVPAGESPYDA